MVNKDYQYGGYSTLAVDEWTVVTFDTAKRDRQAAGEFPVRILARRLLEWCGYPMVKKKSR